MAPARCDVHPTTLGQSSVWFAAQYHGESSAYNVTTVVDIDGDLPRRRVEEAYRLLVEVTPTLQFRTGLGESGDVVQWLDPAEVRVEWVSPAPGAEVDEVLRDAVSRPFEVDGGVLHRIVAARLSASRTRVSLSVHHVLMDGRSKTLLTERFLACLDGSVVAQKPADYLELVERVRAAEASAVRRDLDYWTTRLAPVIGQETIGTADQAAQPVRGHLSQRLREDLSADCVAHFRRIAREAGTGLFSVLFGSIHRVLGVMGRRASVVCTAASVRPRDGFGGEVLGCFVNQVPLVCAHRPGDTLAELVMAEADGWREDLRRRHVPLMVIVNALPRPVPRLDRIFTSYLDMEGTLQWRHGHLSATCDLFNVYHETKTDLTVRFVPHDGRIGCDVEWSDNSAPELGQEFAEVLRSLLAGEIS
ncbi:condensation domain-containing protein [Lentzea rhizosphaerae]|uniref:Condensation domain-containing protein n=1 Tax=Lentzea rhizosphaerae TaxID=2041025 RepID=A0ABV8BM46_9PSEU